MLNAIYDPIHKRHCAKTVDNKTQERYESTPGKEDR